MMWGYRPKPTNQKLKGNLKSVTEYNYNIYK